MAEVVLDASAVLALLQREPGGEEVVSVLDGATISAVNLSEVVSKLIDAGTDPAEAVEGVEELGLDVVEFDGAAAYAAGLLREPTRHAGLSLGDRACLALAVARGATAWTADRAWAGLRVGADVHVLRGPMP